jgi:hypothetical protein
VVALILVVVASGACDAGVRGVVVADPTAGEEQTAPRPAPQNAAALSPTPAPTPRPREVVTASPSSERSRAGNDTPITAGEGWWPDDPDGFEDAFERCGEPDSRWSDVECGYLGGLFMGTHGAYMTYIDLGVDLLAAGRDQCAQLQAATDLEDFFANREEPALWPDGGEDLLFLDWLATVASMTLCPDTQDRGARILELVVTSPSPSPGPDG